MGARSASAICSIQKTGQNIKLHAKELTDQVKAYIASSEGTIKENL